MGTQGLWEYLRKHGLAKSSVGTSSIELDYLMLDMNGVVHTAFIGDEGNSADLIRSTLESVREILRLFSPKKGLCFVFDGVAPLSKLQTQKQRRTKMQTSSSSKNFQHPRSGLAPSSCKYNYDYIDVGVHIARQEILTGSEFLLACEEELRAAFRDGRLRCPAAVTFSGCLEVGEGELKISSVIRGVWLEQVGNKSYTGEDVIVVVGNDSDLALVGIACVPFRNFYLVDPFTHAVTNVGILLSHWGKSLPGERILPELLPSYRIDFVFLILLSGGDWYQGIGASSFITLWRRYRDLRANGGFHRRPLIHGATFDLDSEFLRGVLHLKELGCTIGKSYKSSQRQLLQVTHRADTGVELLKGAMWALRSIVEGRCYDYNFRVHPIKPSIGDLSAAAQSKKLGKRIHPDSEAPLPIFSPLEQCLAVLGTRGRFSAEIQRAMKAATGDSGEKLTSSTSTTFIVQNVRLIREEINLNNITIAERELLEVRCRSDDSTNSFMSFRV